MDGAGYGWVTSGMCNRIFAMENMGLSRGGTWMLKLPRLRREETIYI